MSSLFIFGLGYSASYFAMQALKNGWQVQATCRTIEDKADMEALGVRLYSYDGSQPIEDMDEKLSGVTHVLHSIPPDRETGDAVFHHHGDDLKNIETLEWFGYLSTTGVYGNADGAWVNEDSPRNPSSPRSIARKKAEDDWLSSGLPTHLFRLAGIYGPGRSLFNQIRKGEMRAIDKPGHVFSRIHRNDIAGVLWASIETPQPGSAYNVCDDQPMEPYEVLKWACELLEVRPPEPRPFEEVTQTMSPMAKSFWNDNKKVENKKIKYELDYDLKYPGYQEGLRAILAEEAQ